MWDKIKPVGVVYIKDNPSAYNGIIYKFGHTCYYYPNKYTGNVYSKDSIDQLIAENERLREALEKIYEINAKPDKDGVLFHDVV